MVSKVNRTFRDASGGYYFYGGDHEAMILRPKETYDGAIPSGNGLMAWNLVRLTQLAEDEQLQRDAQFQLDFLSREAAQHPIGHAMFLLALLDRDNPPTRITVVPADDTDASRLPLQLPMDAAVTLLHEPSADHPLKDGKTTFYVCRSHSCLPPTNDLPDA